jgi:formate-dependent nitrite reductase membrane component NrfD
MWSEQQLDSGHVVSGNPTYSNSSAAALLSYDVAHWIPWDWRVSLYTWTKGIAAGVYLVAAWLVMFGFLRDNGATWLWATPVISGAFLALTGGLLIWDLEHPKRFYLIFTRPQWRSWLVKGAFIIGAYSLVLLVHFFASWFGARSVQRWLLVPGIPLAVLTAIYTAYLFAQAKARDMWQNPLLPPHLLVQCLLLGSSVLLLFVMFSPLPTSPTDPLSDLRESMAALLWFLAVGSLLHVLLVWGEITLTHPTAHARLAVWEMMRGRFKSDFLIGMALSILGGTLPWLVLATGLNTWIGAAGAPLALIGMMLYENAYVQAGQSVPLA